MYKFVQFISNKEQSGYIKPSEFNLAAKQAQMSLYLERYGNPHEYTPGNPIPQRGGFGQTQKLQDDFNPFMMSSSFSSSEIDLTQLPCDYAHLVSIHSNGARTAVRIVTIDEYSTIRNSSIVAPSSSYPVAYFGDKMKIYTDGVSSGTVYYLRYPVDPLWDYFKNSNGQPLDSDNGNATTYPVFDDTATTTPYNTTTGYNCSNTGNPYENSVDFEFPYDCFNDIAFKILSYVGINLRENQLTQYSELKEQQGV